MVRNILAAVAAAALLAAVLAAYQAAAMPPGGAAALEPAGDGSLFQKVTNVCGTNGCVIVQTRRVQHHPFNKTAAPVHSGS
jgi:hypothetical protein